MYNDNTMINIMIKLQRVMVPLRNKRRTMSAMENRFSAHNRSSQVKVPDLAIYPLTAYAVLETLHALRIFLRVCPLT